MAEPRASRPHMPGYGTLPGDEGTGLLGWSWAEDRLARSHDYWLSTIHPDGRPNTTPVWGVWHDTAFWFSCSPSSRKARNLSGDPRCTVATDNPLEPVVLEGQAQRLDDRGAVIDFARRADEKYEPYGADFYLSNATFRVRPLRVFGLLEQDFTGSPTRWEF